MEINHLKNRIKTLLRHRRMKWAFYSMLFCILLFFLLRNTILNYAVGRVAEKAEKKFPVKVSIGEASFRGLSGLHIHDLIVIPLNGDTLLSVKQVQLSIRWWPLLRFKIRFRSLEANDILLQLIRKGKQDNYSFLLKRSSHNNDKNKKKKDSVTDYGGFARTLLHTVFDAIPPDVRITSLKFIHEKDTTGIKASIPVTSLVDGVFNMSFSTRENQLETGWHLQGTVDRGNETAEIKMYPAAHTSGLLPWLKSRYQLSTGFDTIYASLNYNDYSDEVLTLKGELYMRNFRVHHWRISPDDVSMAYAGLHYNLRIGAQFAELDSSSRAMANTLEAVPYLKYEQFPSRSLAIHFRVPPVKAQTFFDAFPQGLFQSLRNMKVSGTLGYGMRFYMDTGKPEELQFSSAFNKKKFSIISYGQTNLAKINDEFIYTAYERGKVVKSFPVGPSNPLFTPLHSISPYLQYAVMTSEDGTFFYHNGFNEEAFKKSIAENYRRGKFARGGSTISMQLVKNVFLTRNKTIARKLEEALIVWLMESNRIVSKERMLEVYFNIIEWGPGIYGIGEAASFYFNRKPAELSPEESIFLAMIVPRPKWFRYCFEEDATLKPYTEGYFKLIAGHLVRKEILTEEQKEKLNFKVALTGAARNLVLKPDTLPADTLKPGNEDNLFEE